MDAALRRLPVKTLRPAGAVTSVVGARNGNRQQVQHLLGDGKVKAGQLTLPNKHRAYVVKDPSGAPVFAGITPSIGATHDALLRAGSVPDGWAFSVATASDFSNVCFELTMRDCIRKHKSTGLAEQPPETAPSVVKRACLYEIIKEGKRRFIGVTRDLDREKQLLPSPEMKFRRIRYVDGTCDDKSLRNTLTRTIAASIRAGDNIAAVDHQPVNKFGDLVRQRLLKSTGLAFHVFNAEGVRVFSGITGESSHTVALFIKLGLFYSDKLTVKVPNEDGVPARVTKQSKKRFSAESRRLRKQKVRCIYELTDYRGNRVYVGAAASLVDAAHNGTVVELVTSGCEPRKVRDVPPGRSLRRAKATYIKKCIAEGHSLRNCGVLSAPFLYEVVDERGRRIYVGASCNFQATHAALRSRCILSRGRAMLKVQTIPKDVAVTKAEKQLIVESLQAGDPLQNSLNFVPHLDPSIYTKQDESAWTGRGATEGFAVGAKTFNRKQTDSLRMDGNCVFEIRNLAGQFVYVGAATSRKAVLKHSTVRKLTARGCAVRLLHAVEEGDEALLVAKEKYAALNAQLNKRSPQGRLRATPTIASTLRKGSAPFVELLAPMPTSPPSVPHALPATNRHPERGVSWLDSPIRALPALTELKRSFTAAFERQLRSVRHIERFLSVHSTVIQKNRRGSTPSLSDRGVIYALFDEALTVAYVGQTMHTPCQRARNHMQAALYAWRKTTCLEKMTRIHAAILRNGAPFYVAPLEKVSGMWSCRQTFRLLATEREKHFIQVLKPRFNTTYMYLTRT